MDGHSDACILEAQENFRGTTALQPPTSRPTRGLTSTISETHRTVHRPGILASKVAKYESGTVKSQYPSHPSAR
jgi:hypothetical protein